MEKNRQIDKYFSKEWVKKVNCKTDDKQRMINQRREKRKQIDKYIK